MTLDRRPTADDLGAFLIRLSDIARTRLLEPAGVVAHEDKGDCDFDPVTAFDRDIEDMLRALIVEQFPGDAVWGEERGWTNEGAARIWSIDPVDGTRALICGLPSWAVLAGVIEQGRHVAGLIDLPVLDERLIASGGATTRNGVPVLSSGCKSLGSARLSTTDPYLFEGGEAAGFERVRRGALVTRFGLDALAYARCATGDIDLVIENKLGRHDLDALVAVVRGAGGHIGDWDGGEDWDRGRIVASSSRALYDEVVALLAV